MGFWSLFTLVGFSNLAKIGVHLSRVSNLVTIGVFYNVSVSSQHLDVSLVSEQEDHCSLHSSGSYRVSTPLVRVILFLFLFYSSVIFFFILHHHIVITIQQNAIKTPKSSKRCLQDRGRGITSSSLKITRATRKT